MSDEYNVFISWSGERSKRAAEALRDWLPPVIQSAKPWMSDTDIEKGARGFEEIDKRLAGMRLGIVCLTPENLNAPWILYEAGALSKSIGEKARLWTYLLCGLETKHIPPPLSLFQGTVANAGETRKLLGAINRAVSDNPLPDSTVSGQFEKWWPDLKEKLDRIPEVSGTAEPKRSVEDMIAEILDTTRAGASDREDIRARTSRIEAVLSRAPFANYMVQSGLAVPLSYAPTLLANNPGLLGFDQTILNYWAHQNQPAHNTKAEGQDDQTPQPTDPDGEDPTRQG